MSWHFLNMYGGDFGNRYESMSMTFERVIGGGRGRIMNLSTYQARALLFVN